MAHSIKGHVSPAHHAPPHHTIRPKPDAESSRRSYAPNYAMKSEIAAVFKRMLCNTEDRKTSLRNGSLIARLRVASGVLQIRKRNSNGLSTERIRAAFGWLVQTCAVWLCTTAVRRWHPAATSPSRHLARAPGARSFMGSPLAPGAPPRRHAHGLLPETCCSRIERLQAEEG